MAVARPGALIARGAVRWLAVLAGLSLIAGCATRTIPLDERRTLEVVPPRSWPVLDDELDLESLLDACDSSLTFLGRVDAGSRYRFGPEERTAAELERGVRRFRELMETLSTPEGRREALAAEFILLRSVGRDGRGEVLFTGYYEPLLDARREPGGAFVHPVFGLPDDLVSVDLEAFGIESDPRTLVGRVEAHRLVPYPTRSEIDFGAGLTAPAPVLGYVADPVDAFFLQVQGSGTLVFADGTRLRAGYAASNGRPYRSIGRLLLDDGLVSREAMSMQAIRSYLESHPDDLERVLSYNPSYVFFQPLEATGGPLGCYGVPVTAGRSIATDRGLFPAPVAAWIEGTMPTAGGGQRRFGRFALNQDTGGSIRGPGRVDLFVGAGEAAAEVAGRMQNTGRLYLLLPRRN